MAPNEQGYRFWQHAIKSFAGEEILAARFDQGGNDWHRFAFESRPAAHEPGLAGVAE
jgi:hypothetical protein